MVSKQTSLGEAVAQISDGATLMIGGFGSPGTPFTLIEQLIEQGSRNLTLIKNDANEAGIGISRLIESGQVAKVITSHLGLNRLAIEKMKSGEIEVEFVPQGILAERIRCAGVGLPGFLSDVGLDTEITDPASLISVDGQSLKIERALKADVALLHAHCADRYGNLRYRSTAMNFSPLMAMAADRVIVEVAKMSDTPLAPDHVHTPHIFVDHFVALPELGSAYQLMEHHIHG